MVPKKVWNGLQDYKKEKESKGSDTEIEECRDDFIATY